MRVYKRHTVCKFNHPEDMNLILNYLDKYGEILVDESTIENLYYDFSDEKYSAGWMHPNEQILYEFEEWINELDYY